MPFYVKIFSLVATIIIAIFVILIIFIRNQKSDAKLIVLDGVSSVGKTTIARKLMKISPGTYKLIGIDDYVTPVFLEQAQHPIHFNEFLQRIDTCEKTMFKDIQSMLNSGQPIILDTVMAGIRGIPSIQKNIHSMRSMNKLLILIHLPLPQIIQRITKRNKQALEQKAPQDSRSLVLTLRQLSATYKARNSDNEINLGTLTKHDLEQIFPLASHEFGNDQTAYEQFKYEILQNLSLTAKDTIELTTRTAYDLIVYAEHNSPEECATIITNFINNKEQPTMQNRIVTSGNIELYTEHTGKASHPAILLIAGAMAPAKEWPDEFCQQLADEHYFVIRYDHRDIGLSSAIDYACNSYTITDLAHDAIAILDAYGIQKAHIVGHSMGGGIAQLLALDYPDRVLSITLISSSVLAQAELNAQENESLEHTWLIMAKNKPSANFAESLEGFLHSYAYLHGTIPMDKKMATEYIRAMYENTRPEHLQWFVRYSAGIDPLHNHVKAQQNIKDRTQDLHTINVPVLVIHGEHDCLSFPRTVKEYCVKEIPQAQLHIIPGMGHMILNNELWIKIKDIIVNTLNKKA